MNRRNVENYMDDAYKAIKHYLKNKKVEYLDDKLRGKMSAFGAAVMMSGVKPAVAYFSKNQPEIIKLLEKMNNDHSFDEKDKEKLMEMSVSLKLAMNLYIKPQGEMVADNETVGE